MKYLTPKQPGGGGLSPQFYFSTVTCEKCFAANNFNLFYQYTAQSSRHDIIKESFEQPGEGCFNYALLGIAGHGRPCC